MFYNESNTRRGTSCTSLTCRVLELRGEPVDAVDRPDTVLSRPSLSAMTDTRSDEPTEDVAPGQNTPAMQGEPVIPISGLIAAALEPKMSPARTPMKRAVIQREGGPVPARARRDRRPTISLEEAVRATSEATATLQLLYRETVTMGMGFGTAMARTAREEQEARDAREEREVARSIRPDHFAELRAEVDLARQLVEQVEANMRDVRKALEVLSRDLRWHSERQR